MNIHLQLSKVNPKSAITISGSKSESNRVLILQALYPNITLTNISNSDDTKLLAVALSSDDNVIDIHHAGTAMRFLTAFFAIQDGREVTLTGSPRMKQRPIKTLVDALLQLGAQIDYLENDGFPPIKIKGQKIAKNQVTLNAHISSQYISALLLIAPKLENGLETTINEEITSLPYIKMTLDLLDDIGVKSFFSGNKISVQHQPSIADIQLSIESDWSSASYFYSIVALAPEGTEITLSTFNKDSIQGDSVLVELYKSFGVETTFNKDNITIKKISINHKSISFDLNNTPDLAQTIVVTSFGLGIDCHLTGLHTLQIKETDRLQALKTELTQLGANVTTTENTITIKPSNDIKSNITIQTYDDHRMAMAFAPLALKVPITIDNPNVVSKSYPTFWHDLNTIGFTIL